MLKKRTKKQKYVGTQKKKYLAVYGASIVLLLAIVVYQTQADTVTVFFNTFLHSETPLTQDNEVTAPQQQYELRWSDFTSEIPPETDVSKITLRFSVSNSINTVPVNDTETASSSVDTEGTTTVSVYEPSTTTRQNDIDSPVESPPSTLPIDIETTHSLEVERVPFETEETATVPQEASSNSVSENDSFISNEDAVTVNESLKIDTETIPETTHVLSFTETDTEEIYTTEVLPLDVVVLDTQATTTKESQATSLYEVLYSLDGVSWQSLGEGDYATDHNMTFNLSEISLADIPSLVVTILYSADTETNRSLLFSQMRLEIDCILLEEILEPVLSRPIDLEPNFQNSAVKADITSENLRAVLVERGSMLELWYGFVDFATKEIQWRQLASDGSLGATTPIAIQSRTIFWLDKNQQTLFGFSIDTQSLFGNSLASDTENTLQLQFVSKTGEMWNVVYNPESISFEFTKVAIPR